MQILRDRALLLRRTPYGESSLVAQVLTPRHGRVHLIAKGAYRPTSRYFAVLDLFDTLELEWSRPRGGGLGLLRQGSIARRRRRATASLPAYRAALATLELTELAARPGQDDGQLFALVEASLEGLELGAARPELVAVVFELGFLQNLGLAPALERCAACGGPAPPIGRDSAGGDRAAFSAGAGGRLCRTCADEARAAGRRVGTLPSCVLAAAATLERSSPREPHPAELEPALLDRVRDCVGRFLDYHLETRPASHRRFLSTPNRNAPQAGEPPAFPPRSTPSRR